MKEEQQRIAIAGVCGWSEIITASLDGPMGRETKGANWGKVIPDYLNDLNAMHEAEKRLIGDQFAGMRLHLNDVVPRPSPIWHATAAQRAEAFLKTLNLWEN